MFKSVVCISSPLRGTPLASALGQLDGPSAGQKRFSVGWMMSLGIHFAKTANVFGNELYDFGGDHFMTTHGGEDEETANTSKYGVVDSVCDYLAGKTLGFSADSAGFDMLMTAMDQHNKGTKLCPETFYRAYAVSTVIP